MIMRRTHITWIVLMIVIFAVVSSMIKRNDLKEEQIIEMIERDVGIEGFEEPNDDCPDALIREGGTYYLFNTRKQPVPGVNPVKFENLNGYREYLRWQRAHGGKRCPVLQLQHSHTVAGVKNHDGYVVSGSYDAPYDIQQRRESMIHFSREHSLLCGEESTIDPKYCMKEDFDEHNRGPAIVNGKYVTKLDGIVPMKKVYPYDPMNQYIGVNTRVDD